MPKLIFTSRYMRDAPPQYYENYVRYISTREGVETIEGARADLPASQNQKKLITQLIRDIPDAKNMLEYADFLGKPTMENASEFITCALEQNLDLIGKRKNYVDYIAHRPRVERIGKHGLFTDAGTPIVISQVQKDVAAHKGPVWTHVISLRREDAARLGYDSAAQWTALLRSKRAMLCKYMKIDSANLRWYAAFHNEGHHPHVHMICYSADPSKGYLTKSGIAQIKSALVNDLFRNDLMEIYGRQTEQRDSLSRETKEVLNQLIQKIQETKSLDHSHLADLLLQLSDRLRFTSGKKQYGYLKAPLKSLVDEIVDELEKEPVVKEAYACWYELREEVLRSYRDDLPERLPLSRQKEFKNIKNLVIRQAVRLGEDIQEEAESLSERAGPDPIPEASTHTGWSSQDRYRSAAQRNALQLLRHLGNFFREQTPVSAIPTPQLVDQKLKRKIQEKKKALGLKQGGPEMR